MKVLQANYGGGKSDIAYDVVGNSNSFGSGGYDILIVKMDVNKKILWSNTYGVAGDETIRKASLSPDGGILVTGQTTSFSNIRGEILCMKVKPDGSIQWVRTFGIGSANGDLGSEIIQTSDGGYAVTGVLNEAGYVADGIVIKLDASANITWSKRFNTGTGDDGSGIIETGDKLVAVFDSEDMSGEDYGAIITEMQTSNCQVITSKKIISSLKGILRPILYKDFLNGYWLSGHLILGSNYDQMEQVILKLANSLAVSKVYKIVKSPLTNYFFTGFAPLKSGGFITCASEPLNAGGKGHIFKIGSGGEIFFSKQIHTNGKSSLNALTLNGDRIIAVGSDNSSGTNDYYLADFDTSGYNVNLCNFDTSIIAIQNHSFSIDDFEWPSINDQPFISTIQTVSQVGQVINTNAICKKDTCQPIKVVTPEFEIPDTVCVNSPVAITNKTVGATTHYWNFCVSGLSQIPDAINLGNIGGAFSLPVFMDYAYDNGNYYGFVTNYNPGGLTRLDLGNSLLNTPKAASLGNFDGALTLGEGTEGLQIVQNEGKWYAIIVGGNMSTGYSPRIVKIEFGTNLSNPLPTATNWGNLGNMDHPIDLHVFKEGSNWYGLTLNAENNSITRFNFTGSFNNIPTATNLGNIGNLAYPTGIYAINDNGFWRAFVVNGGNRFQDGINSSITRLDFGNSLSNIPLGINLGNPGNLIQHPRDITIIKSCNEIAAFVVNGKINGYEIIKLDLGMDMSKTLKAESLGNIGNLNFPHSISRIFRVDNNLYAFVTNVNTNTLTRLVFKGCSNSAIPNSNFFNPLPVTYNNPGVYNINLTVDDGLPTQATLCKQVVVLPDVKLDFGYFQDTCNVLKVNFIGSDNLVLGKWDFGDGSTSMGSGIIAHLYSKPGTYKIGYQISSRCGTSIIKTIKIGSATSNIIQTVDTTICENSSIRLKSDSASTYCWTPSLYLSNSYIGNPVASPPVNIRYTLLSKKIGANLIENGDFSLGNNGFYSGYTYSNSGINASTYFVALSPNLWNPSMPNCKDHTSGNGNMMLVNGAGVRGVEVWKQKVTVTANADYEFAYWLEYITTINPAKFQITINGVRIGEIITGNFPSWQWNRFSINWNAGVNTTAEISIVNMNTDSPGNDFALDDISFASFANYTDTVIINIEKPFVSAGNDTSVCSKSSLLLKANGATTYNWYPTSGLSNPNIFNPELTIGDTAINYIVSGFSINGCIAKDTIRVSVLPLPVITVSNDTSVCGNNKVQLLASGGVQYSWSPVNGLSNPAISNPLVNVTIPQRFSVTVTNSEKCVGVKSIYIDVLPLPVAIVSGDTTVCGNNPIQLLASGGNSFKWSPTSGLSNANISNPIATIEKDIRYDVQITGTNGCSANESVSISIKPKPQFGVKDNAVEGCLNTTTQLLAFGGNKYQWNPSLGLTNPGIPNPWMIFQNAASYSVIIQDTVCKEQATFTIPVTIKKLPQVNVLKSNDISCNVSFAQLLTSHIPNAISYIWSPANGLDNPNIGNPVAVPLQSTVYRVTVKDKDGCEGSGTVEVKVVNNGDFRLYQLPIGFTPNGDGKNDCFGINSWGNVDLIEFLIFNRWGQIVFQGSNSLKCWDGRLRGNPQPAANYVYKLKALTLCGVVERQGNVILIR